MRKDQIARFALSSPLTIREGTERRKEHLDEGIISKLNPE